MMSKLISLDTMCFICLFENNEKYIDSVKKLLNKIEANKVAAVISIISVIEAFSEPFLQENSLKREMIESYFYKLNGLKVIPVENSQVTIAADLRRKYKIRTPDAIQLATAITQKVDVFITNDKKLKQVSEIKVKLISEI